MNGSDEWASQVRVRVCGAVSYLHAADACYHGMIPSLLAGHALSGCDTVAIFYRVGKGKMLRKNVSVNKIGNIQAHWCDVMWHKQPNSQLNIMDSQWLHPCQKQELVYGRLKSVLLKLGSQD